MSPYFVNPHIFFLSSSDGFIVWNYEENEQYLIESKHLQRITLHAQGIAYQEDSILDKELEEANIISKSTYEDSPWEWDILSKIFHMGTENLPHLECSKESNDWILTRLEENEKALKKFQGLYIEKTGPQKSLPPPDFSSLKSKSLFEILSHRKTCRDFFESQTSLQDISTLLFSAFGRFHQEDAEIKELGLQDVCLRKTSPSGGGLHPTEVYLAALNVEGLEPGIYHYNVKDHLLVSINNAFNKNDLQEILHEQFYMQNISAGLFLTSCFHKIWQKYPNSRAYRVALMDVGHISQTTLLIATALGFQTWVSGAFREDQAKKLLQLTTIEEAPLFFIGLGHGSNQMLPAAIKSAIKGETTL